jgi:hypothetical protein
MIATGLAMAQTSVGWATAGMTGMDPVKAPTAAS